MSLFATLKKMLRGMSNQEVELEYLINHGMHLGKNSTINSGCLIDSGWPWLISIGDHVTIAPNVTILAHDASPDVVECGTKLGKVSIGNHVFIGTRSVILCNTRIGDNVVIGAGSVVTHDLPSNGVYAGAPAVRICSIEEYRQKNRRLMETRPYFGDIRRWDDWRESTDEEKELMKRQLEDGCGFI